MSIYFPKRPLWSGMGIFIIAFALYNFFNTYLWVALIWLVLGIGILFSHYFTYISLYDQEMIIRGRKFILWNKRIRYEDIDYVEIIGDHTIIHKKSQKTFSLNNLWMEDQGPKLLRRILTEKGISIK